METGKKFISVLFAAILILVFIYTVISKLIDLNTFRYLVMNQPLPAFINRILFWVLPITELLIAGLLLLPKTKSIGFIGSSFIMTAFTVYVGLMLYGTFENVPCSCGGITQSLTWSQHFILNIALLLISIIGLKISPSVLPVHWRRRSQREVRIPN